MVLLTRLILLEPGTIQSHPDMGVGLISKFRYSVEGGTEKLQNTIQQQIAKYIPELQGTRITVNESNSQYLIAAEFEGVLYGIALDKTTNTVTTKVDTSALVDL